MAVDDDTEGSPCVNQRESALWCAASAPLSLRVHTDDDDVDNDDDTSEPRPLVALATRRSDDATTGS